MIICLNEIKLKQIISLYLFFLNIRIRVILACAIARARPHTHPKMIWAVQLTCEICYYMPCKCAKYCTPSNFFIDKTDVRAMLIL